MWLAVLGIGILLAVAGIVLLCMDHECSGPASFFIGLLLIIVSIIACLFCLDGVIQNKYIDEKIDMYIEENAAIETQIAEVVEQYQKYETDIFEGVTDGREDAMILVSLYPELKSDALVQQQIEIYSANNQKIKELKEQKIANKSCAWWLYFG